LHIYLLETIAGELYRFVQVALMEILCLVTIVVVGFSGEEKCA
jgi:hypothetical protein